MQNVKNIHVHTRAHTSNTHTHTRTDTMTHTQTQETGPFLVGLRTSIHQSSDVAIKISGLWLSGVSIDFGRVLRIFRLL